MNDRTGADDRGSTAPPIAAGRVQLRDFTGADFDAVHRYASDPRVTANLCWGPNSAEQTRAFLARAEREAGAVPRSAYSLGIEEIAAGEIIGGIHLRPHGEEPGAFELGYCLRFDRWGRGLASEAVTALTAFGFRHLRARRVVAEVFTANPASARILEKLNFRPGEAFERHVTCRDERYESRLFTLGRETWLAADPQ